MRNLRAEKGCRCQQRDMVVVYYRWGANTDLPVYAHA